MLLKHIQRTLPWLIRLTCASDRGLKTVGSMSPWPLLGVLRAWVQPLRKNSAQFSLNLAVPIGLYDSVGRKADDRISRNQTDFASVSRRNYFDTVRRRSISLSQNGAVTNKTSNPTRISDGTRANRVRYPPPPACSDW